MEGAYISSLSTGVLYSQAGGTSYINVPVTSASIDPACFETYKSVEDGVLIDNQRVKEELNSFEEVTIQQMPLDAVIAEADLFSDDQLPAKVGSIAKITAGSRSRKKRGRKKSATAHRSRR